MLAIQRPGRMGSTQPSDPNVAFGYTLDPSPDLLFDVPEPARGAPILSDTESRFLGSFFEGIGTDHYNMDSFGEDFNFSESWLDLPPQFMGTATSFGQHPNPQLSSPAHALPNNEFPDILSMGTNMMPPPSLPQPPQRPLEHHPSADVLEAASVLQGGSASRSSGINQDGLFPSRDLHPPSLGLPVGHLRHQPMADFKQEGRRNLSATGDHDNTFTDMFFGSSERPLVPRPNHSTDLQWGSDSRFSRSQVFVPESEKDSFQALEQQRLKYIECLEVNASRETTQPSSPTDGACSPVKLHARQASDLARQEDDADSPPRKRRKSKPNKSDSDDEDDEPSSMTKTARKRKSKGDTAAPQGSPPRQNGANSKRRKSGVNCTKPPRENLTEEQKRENHIRSEQKRRTFIREGYDDLCDIVPGLKDGSFSKSTMLGMAADWLDELLRGNERLRAQLAALEGR